MSVSGDGRSLVEHPHHLLGGDPVGEHAGDERAGAGADVDVELVDRAVDGEQVERPQGADLVHAAGEPAAAQDERGLRTDAGDFSWLRAPRDSVRGVSSSTTFPMASGALCTGRRRSTPGSRFVRGRSTANRAGLGARVRAARAAPRPARRVDLALPPGARAGQADATRRRRQRRLGQRPRRVRPRPAVQLGVEDRRASSPRTRSCSRRPPCSTGSAPNGQAQDHGLSAAPLGPSTGTRSRQPRAGRRRRPGARRAAASPSTTTCPSRRWARSPRRSRKDGIKRVTGKVLRRRQRLRPPAGRPDDRRRRLGRPRPAVGPLVRLRLRSTATTPPAPSWSPREPSPTSSATTACGSRRAPAAARSPGSALRHRPLAKVSSPSMSSLITATNRPSNNFFAEMLLKRLAANGKHVGTTEPRRSQG